MEEIVKNYLEIKSLDELLEKKKPNYKYIVKKVSPDDFSFTVPFTVCCANMVKEELKRSPIKNNLKFFMYNLLNNNYNLNLLLAINLHSTL